MQRQITRNNHYVPKWYQKGFLDKGQHKLHVLNLSPGSATLPNGAESKEPELEQLGPKRAFVELDLYTTRFGDALNDDIETFLFGEIDTSGALAVRAWINGDPNEVHRRFLDFFEYLDAQKLRTPKGLDWIQSRFKGLPHVELMLQMQALRQMHVTMWSECVREIVSASNSFVKFIVSDHPVTIFHPDLGPGSEECAYPGDPGIELVGAQTLFPLGANHCLILTNLEYAQDPSGANRLARRTNARFRGSTLPRTDAFIRGRELTEAEVIAVNRVMKARAKKFVAASNPDWLHPERLAASSWHDIGPILLPKDGLWQFGGETFIGYKDGSTSYRDQFGRQSRAHEYLSRKVVRHDLRPKEPCGCGSGMRFGDCCADVPPHRRPAWGVLSIRERNLILCQQIRKILQMSNEETEWTEVRRRFGADHVRQINEVFAALWPVDTQLVELLPLPQNRRTRGLYLGMVDARDLHQKVIGMLPYVDEVVAVHPFVNPNGVRSEFSGVTSPDVAERGCSAFVGALDCDSKSAPCA